MKWSAFFEWTLLAGNEATECIPIATNWTTTYQLIEPVSGTVVRQRIFFIEFFILILICYFCSNFRFFAKRGSVRMNLCSW